MTQKALRHKRLRDTRFFANDACTDPSEERLAPGPSAMRKKD